MTLVRGDGHARHDSALSPRSPHATSPDRVEQLEVNASPEPGPRRSVGRPKMSFYQDSRNTARLRSAVFHTMKAEGIESLSQFIDDAVMGAVRELELRYNEGRPFPPVPPGGLPRGRPVRRVN